MLLPEQGVITMKKIVFSLLCVLLACSLLFCGCGKDDKVSDGDAAVADYSLDASFYDDDIAQVNLLIEGNYYLKGSMTDNEGISNVLEIAVQNGNSFMASKMEGVEIGIMTVDSEYYMVYPDGQCVLHLDETVSSTMGFDPAELQFDSSKYNFGELSEEKLVNTEEALVDNETATCRTYLQDTGNYIKTYTKDGLVIRIQNENANGAVVSVMDIELLTNKVPDEKVSLPSGYKLYSGATGMMAFMMKLASAMDIDLSE